MNTDDVLTGVNLLLSYRDELLALRMLLDKHRKDIYPHGTEEPNRAETDEEVIVRLGMEASLYGHGHSIGYREGYANGKADAWSSLVGTGVRTEGGSAIGIVRAVNANGVYVAVAGGGEIDMSRPAPKPIRLHAGQIWEKDGYENVIEKLQPYPFGPRKMFFPYKDNVGHWLEVDAGGVVIDANGWRCIAGPGAPPFDMRTL